MKIAGIAIVVAGTLFVSSAMADDVLCDDAETMISDMGGNDAPARGVNPAYGWSRAAAANTAIATYSRQPAWWKADNPEYTGVWGRILPWFVIFEGADSLVSPVDIQIGRMSIRYLSRTDGAWHILDHDAPWETSICPPASDYVGCPMVELKTGRDDLPTFANGGNLGNAHGWFRMLKLPDPYDVRSLTVSVQIRKTGPNAERSLVLAHVGADFYPDAGRVEGPNPGAGLSKMKLIGTEWTTVTMTVLQDLTGNDTGITAAELRSHPPACPAPLS